MTRGIRRGLLLTLAAFWWPGLSLCAQTISLELRPSVSHAQAGATVEIGLYAVADSGEPLAFRALEAVPIWTAETITLLGLTNNGPYAWFLSSFPADGQLDDLNATWLDGDAFYQSFARFPPSPPPSATAEGLLVTTWRFEAGEAGAAALFMVPSFGTYSFTRVHDAEEPGVFLTGSLGGATVVVSACGLVADVDADCDVDLVDYVDFNECLGGPALDAILVCNFRDLNVDNRIDLRDFAEFQRLFTGEVGE